MLVKIIMKNLSQNFPFCSRAQEWRIRHKLSDHLWDFKKRFELIKALPRLCETLSSKDASEIISLYEQDPKKATRLLLEKTICTKK